MCKFKAFIKKWCLPCYEEQVVMKSRTCVAQRFRTYDLETRDKVFEDNIQDPCFLFGRDDEFFERYKNFIPVTTEWLEEAFNDKIINHGYVDIIF